MPNPQGLKKLLEAELNDEEINILPSSFDVVGDILIFSDFPVELEKKEEIIGQTILEAFKNIKVVCKKVENYSGEFRTPKLNVIAGENRKETIHKENAIRISLDVEKVYFSARLAHERERINHQIKANESVLVMFSGCGVYPINISKNTKAKEIYGVEINPVAHDYALKNLTLNKAQNVKLFLGDVNAVLPKIRKKFDRVIMPLPKSAGDFIGVALKKTRKKGLLHFYDFLHENEFDEGKSKLESDSKKFKHSCEILNMVKCGQYGPRKFRVCFDARIN